MCPLTKRPLDRQRGFTLLEVLVAVGIFAIISIMANTALMNVIKSTERIEVERATWRSFAMLYLRMEEDLAQARPRTVRDTNGVPIAAMIGQTTDTRALGAASLEFTRGGIALLPTDIGGAPAPNATAPQRPPRSDLQRVGYRLNDGKLSRLTWPELDRGPQSQPQETVLLKDVEEFGVRFYEPGDQWTEFWPPKAANGTTPDLTVLPRGVEVRLVIKGRPEIKRLFLVHG